MQTNKQQQNILGQLNLRCLSFLFRVERVDIIKDNVCNYL